jgi:branched-chain amino acid transport system ATP-binding protein
MTGSVLDVCQLRLRFGGLQVLDGVDVQVKEGQIVGLIGPNGAGKTSFFNCVTGIYKPQQGAIRFRGRDVTILPTHRRARLGIARSWQNLGVVGSLTVFENVLLAQHQHAGYNVMSGLLGLPPSWQRERELRRDTAEILDYLGLQPYASERVEGLPYGVQKLCDLAMTLATDPELVLLDEPSSGMSPEEAHQLGQTLTELRDALKLTILMIEHHVPLVVGVCDYVYVLNFGSMLAHGEPGLIQEHPEVAAAYLGEGIDGST